MLARRNYPCANFVGSFFGRSADYLRPGSTPSALVAYLNNTQHFASSLYLCGLASALLVKNLVEAHRSRNALGHGVRTLSFRYSMRSARSVASIASGTRRQSRGA